MSYKLHVTNYKLWYPSDVYKCAKALLKIKTCKLSFVIQETGGFA
jgi:hypothetical protein